MKYMVLLSGMFFSADTADIRLAPHGRKLELFGRKHNTRPGWLTLGNQR